MTIIGVVIPYTFEALQCFYDYFKLDVLPDDTQNQIAQLANGSESALDFQYDVFGGITWSLEIVLVENARRFFLLFTARDQHAKQFLEKAQGFWGLIEARIIGYL